MKETVLAQLFADQNPIPLYCIHPTPQWAPLALGLILGYAAEHLDPQRFDTAPRFAATREELQALMAVHGPGICLFSNYMWTRPDNLEISRWVKAHSPQSLTIHGGPDTPAYFETCKTFLQEHPEVDFAVHGEGEVTITELLEFWAETPVLPEKIPGLGFLVGEQLVKTAARARAENPNLYPSPYLNGIFESLDYSQWSSAALETNRGCPYGCTFCDWGSATLQKIRLYDLERVKAEIEWLGQHKISEFWITDANFGIFERDVEITRFICQAKETYGYPVRVVTNYAKNTKKHLVDIIEILIDAGLLSSGIVSLQSRDEATLKAVNRTNIKTSEYDKLRKTFEDKHLPLSTQLMIGLPGSTCASFKQDLRFCFYQDIEVQIFRTVVLPNSPMADPDYLNQWQIQYDSTGMLLSTRDISDADMRQIEQIARLFRCTHAYGMLKYWQSWLDWEYGLDPIDYLDQLLLDIPQLEGYTWLPGLYDAYSPAHDVINTHFELRESLRSANAWGAFYAELKRYTLARYPQVQEDAQMDMLLLIQAALMPGEGRSFPVQLSLPHDFNAYYQAKRLDATAPALLSYGPAQLEIEDPLGLCQEHVRRGYRVKGRPSSVWELQSDLMGASRELAHSMRHHA
ncbi:hypothetical protein COW36_24185 [bacterium (Candidatus Blackallbacteria) CG17_big_fil_post_rev_8_21_14_2_50_48_46]|uniref:Uncharacterized protein n=1 Tax=bacterium (Candidatus Blackallbacteria) CG17_big_fil_post_rev_8_21_14_2_50_48_46 TaxID=2014261 RepID=A0A2M7FWZ9_9BACT|nr:MAG: hypothetical protein COW64_19125 [bacterium (Candidatus Blackallbacteria) CG18_big_fil_WC_8_21_14_2_50_49_26]PIW13770.1 MAG: hypothetical protein COW36_24185 [bacterium (Candidatus Blackallbacteria) CG17_big_fil_post_rev_8_21_14_2_50_48_46]PIW44996.1 MAG: hypothetical protein COW20_21815 [bacterium (Candidatus Blackallbacteria) CG13_big_fil_rev_8_21_14_2_50_49_14]